jgi:anti-sigma factor RsiW
MNDKDLEIHALVDGEISDEKRSEVQERISSDPQAAAQYEWISCLKKTLQSKCTKLTDDECWQRAMKQIQAINRTNSTERFVRRYAWSFCALFLIAIVSASFIQQTGSGPQLSTSSMAGIFTGLEPVSSSAAPDSIPELLRSGVGSAPSGISDSMDEVEEIAVGEIDGRRAARVSFKDGSGTLHLIVVEDASSVEGVEDKSANGYYAGSINGVRCVSWKEGRYMVILGGDRPWRDLATAANHVRGR